MISQQTLALPEALASHATMATGAPPSAELPQHTGADVWSVFFVSDTPSTAQLLDWITVDVLPEDADLDRFEISMSY